LAPFRAIPTGTARLAIEGPVRLAVSEDRAGSRDDAAVDLLGFGALLLEASSGREPQTGLNTQIER
jgi:hypothetical protein